MVFFTWEIGQKGPKNDIGQLDQGAILDKSILILSILTNYTLSFWLAEWLTKWLTIWLVDSGPFD
jgi:hypothetical protein